MTPLTAFCVKCGVRVHVDAIGAECPRCHFDTVVGVGTQLTIIYAGGLDRVTDAAIRAAIDPFDTGSGYSFVTDERDVSATVPEAELPRVLRALRKIVGVKVKWKVGDDWIPVPTATGNIA